MLHSCCSIPVTSCATGHANVPAVVVTASAEELTAVAGVALWGPLLDRLGVVADADRRGLRPIGPGGYTGGECYRALIETQLAGGDFLSDRTLLADDATAALRGTAALPSTATLSRFLAAATLGWTAKAAAVNRRVLARAWAARPASGGRATWRPSRGYACSGVQYQVHVQVLGDVQVDQLQEEQEVLVAAAGPAVLEHPARRGVQRREDRGGAVSPVVVRHRAGPPRRERQRRLGALEGLGLGLLVHTQHDRPLRRVQVQADDIDELGLEVRVGGQLEGLDLPRDLRLTS